MNRFFTFGNFQKYLYNFFIFNSYLRKIATQLFTFLNKIFTLKKVEVYIFAKIPSIQRLITQQKNTLPFLYLTNICFYLTEFCKK